MAKPLLTPPFTLINEDGRTYVYDDMASLDAACRAGGISIAAQHKNYLSYLDRLRVGQVFRHCEWIVRDLFGRVVTTDDIRAARLPYRYLWDNCRDAQQMAAERGLPIPYTGGHRRGRWNYYRHPRHMSVYREAEISRVLEREEGWKVRGKIHCGPNAWDDIPARDYGHRTWKRSRKTRWRVPAVSYKFREE